MLVPVFQQTTLRMLQLAQQYQREAEEVKRDNLQYGRGPSAVWGMRTHAESLAVTLLRAQFIVLGHLATMPWPETDPLHSIVLTLYMSSELTTAALQTLVAACVDLQVQYKDMARQQQLMKRRKKQQQQSGQQVALNPLLLKLTVPADHVNVGVPPGWEDGAEKPLRFTTSLDHSPQAYVCHLMEIIIWNHVLAYVIDNPLTEGVWMSPSKNMGIAQSKVCRLEVMKLLLETTLLLQGTEPEAGVHQELQHLLDTIAMDVSKEDALVLLRERGGLLMQAATLSTAEEWVMSGKEVAPWQRKERQQEGSIGGNDKVATFDWLSTLAYMAGHLGEFSRKQSHGATFWSMISLMVLCRVCLVRW